MTTTDPLAELRAAAEAAVPVLGYVAMGRDYIGVEPYPDATARRVLAVLVDALEATAPATAEDRARQLIRNAIAADATWSQASLALRLGLTQKHISQVLTGKAGLSFDLAERMLAALGRRLEITATTAPAQTEES